jgi:transcription elongation factor Elf1
MSGVNITLDALKKRKCMLCGDSHKSISNVMLGQTHIATVTVCCNCGLTLTFSHSASEYAKYLESGEYQPYSDLCPEKGDHCMMYDNECPRVKYGRKI